MWEMSLEVPLPIKIHNEIELSPKFFSWCKSKVILSLLLPVPRKLVVCHFLYFLGFFQHCVYLGQEPKFIKAGTCAHTCTQNNNNINNLYQKLPTIFWFLFSPPPHLYSTLLQSQINLGTPNPPHTTLPCSSHSGISDKKRALERREGEEGIV